MDRAGAEVLNLIGLQCRHIGRCQCSHLIAVQSGNLLCSDRPDLIRVQAGKIGGPIRHQLSCRKSRDL